MKRNLQAVSPNPHRSIAAAVGLCGLVAWPPAFAQVAPDAGRVLREQAPVLEAPKASPEISVEAPKPLPTPPGGAEVALRAVDIHGNSSIAAADLLAVLGDVAGKTYDLAGLRELADRVADHYRRAGYPFARAYLPPQSMTAGVLRIEVVEGRYGQVKAQGDAELAAAAQPFLAPLNPGDVIASSALERTTLILNDQPGIRVVPIIRPGEAVGTGDLDVEVKRTARYAGEVGIDNNGNRYTGQTQAHLNLTADSPFAFGDQISLRSLLTEDHMWFGTLGYSLPLGSSGLRGQASYAHTDYRLGKDFANLDASGIADLTSVGLSYPLVRAQKANLSLSGNYQHKRLHDKQAATATDSRKSSDLVLIALRFDARDQLGGGGITYGALTWTAGDLKLADSLIAADRASARTDGGFDKLNLDLARVQTVSADTSLYGRISAQWADKNLDSSEKFGLGGSNGVRAYPVGEGFGDEGWFTQLEVRHAIGAFAPYAFYDSGTARINAAPWAAGENKQNIHGAGVGLRYLDGAWNVDASLAWRMNDGRPRADTADRVPRAWFTASYKF